MKYLLDTNIIVAMTVRAEENVVRRAAECEDGEMVTSAVALAEVAFGTERGDPPTMELLRAFLEEVPSSISITRRRLLTRRCPSSEPVLTD